MRNLFRHIDYLNIAIYAIDDETSLSLADRGSILATVLNVAVVIEDKEKERKRI